MVKLEIKFHSNVNMKILVLILLSLISVLNAATLPNINTTLYARTNLLLRTDGSVPLSTNEALKIGTQLSPFAAIVYTNTAPLPSFYRGTPNALHIVGGGTNMDINLAPKGLGMVTITDGIGLGFKPNTYDGGPDYGPTIGAIAYRRPTESMKSNFFLFRGGEYVFENELAQWQLIITPSGVNVGSPYSATNVIPKNRLEVNGALVVGSNYVRTYTAPENGALIEGNVAIGTTSSTIPLTVYKAGIQEQNNLADLVSAWSDRGLRLGTTTSGEASVQGLVTSTRAPYHLILNGLGGYVGVGNTNVPTVPLDINNTNETLMAFTRTGVSVKWGLNAYNSGSSFRNLTHDVTAIDIKTNGVVTLQNALQVTNTTTVSYFSGALAIGTNTAPANVPIRIIGVPEYANNAAAIAGGLTKGSLYRTGGDPDALCIVH